MISRLPPVTLIAASYERDVLREIEDLYKSRVSDFRRISRALLGDSEAARDAVQDGFVRAVGDHARFRGDAPLEAWVWGCVMHSIQDTGRALGKHRSLSLADVPPCELVGYSGIDNTVRAAIQRLPERQRLVLFLRHYADLGYAEIGVALGIATGTVSATLHAAHEALRTELKGAVDDAT